MEEIEFKVDPEIHQSICQHEWMSFKSPEYHYGFITACRKCGLRKELETR